MTAHDVPNSDPKSLVLDDLSRRILSMELEPGARLDEAGLAKHYALSRTPMREVLQRLAGSGFVILERNRGAQVALMDLSTMRVFFQTAPMVYAAIGQLATQSWTGPQLHQLKDAQAAFSAARARDNTEEAALANHAFHRVIGEMAHNPYLSAALDRLLIDHTRLSQTFYRPRSEEGRARVDTAQAHHDAMIAAVEGGDADAMTRLTMEHWDLSRDRLEDFVRPEPLTARSLISKDHSDAI
ncbi:GntR family transcriptional regulator [Roseobacteraceae bacterium S113]